MGVEDVRREQVGKLRFEWFTAVALSFFSTCFLLSQVKLKRVEEYKKTGKSPETASVRALTTPDMGLQDVVGGIFRCALLRMEISPPL